MKILTQEFKASLTNTKSKPSVVVDQEIQQFKTAPRIIFWITTADAQTDEQVRDRLLRIDITEDPKHTQEIIDFIFEQRKSGAATFDPHEIEVCRAIVYLLKQVFVDVVIPFADHIKFYGDPRGATIFADLVSSFAIWRHQTREKGKNGAVIASYEDYKDAETFFNAIKGHSDTKYTPGELRTLQAIKDLHGEATREMIMEKTGFSKGALSDILNGRSRDGQAKYGLLHKCAALTEEDEGTLKWVDRDTKISKKKKVYRLSEDYDILKAYGKAVSLDTDETNIKRHCSDSSSEFADSSQVKNEFGKDVVRKFVEYNNIRERGTNNVHPSHLDKENSFSLSHPAKSCELANLEPPGVDSSVRTSSAPSANYPTKKAEDSGSRLANQRGEELASKTEEHAKKPQPTDLVKVRFLKDYRTQIADPDNPKKYADHLYEAGDTVMLQRWMAEDLLKRGIVELVAA